MYGFNDILFGLIVADTIFGLGLAITVMVLLSARNSHDSALKSHESRIRNTESKVASLVGTTIALERMDKVLSNNFRNHVSVADLKRYKSFMGEEVLRLEKLIQRTTFSKLPEKKKAK